MRLSTRTRYGTRAMAELAVAYPDKVLSAREVAERQHISFKYLEQIMATLRAAGLVVSQRGLHGGYSLARRPEEISLLEVYNALEGSPAPVDCVRDGQSCPLEDVCPSQEIWASVRDSIQRVLAETSLQDLADNIKEKSRRSPPMYHI